MMTSQLFVLIYCCCFISCTLSTSYFEDYLGSIQLSDFSDEERKEIKDSLLNVYQKEFSSFEKSQKVFQSTTRKSKLIIKNETSVEFLPQSEPTFQNDNSILLHKSFKSKPRILEELNSNNFLIEDEGSIFLMNEKDTFSLTVLNIWTKSSTGCSCAQFSTSKLCACCEDGGCVCSSNESRCVECGWQLDRSLCLEHESTEVVTSFRHKNAKSEVMQTILMGGNKMVKFYSYDQNSKTLRELRDGQQPLTLEATNGFTNIRYVEMLVYDIAGLHKRRFLFAFSDLGVSNVCFEILINTEGESINVRNLFDWSQKGSNFDAANVEGLILVGYILQDSLILEHVKINGNNVVLSKFYSFNNFQVTTWQFFKIGRNDIILITGKDLVKIFLYDTGRILPLQEIPVKRLEKVISVPMSGYQNEAVVIFIFNDRMEFYSQDKNLKFLRVMTQKFESRYNLQTATPIVFKDTPFLLIESRFGSDLYILNIAPIKDGNSVVLNDQLRKRFRNLKSKYEYQINLLKKHEESNSPFREIAVEKLIDEESEDSLASLKRAQENLEKSVEEVEWSLHKIQASLHDVVPKSGTKRTITGTKHFYGPKTSIEELVANFASTGDLLTDKEPLAKIIQNLVRIDDERPIEGRKIFGGKIRVENLHTSTLNSKDMENYVTSNKPVEIDGATYVNGIYVQDDIVMYPNSEVYGIDLSEDVVTQRGYHELGNCHFEDLNILGGIEVESDIVNFESFKDLTTSFLKSEGDVSVYGPVTFTNLTVKGNLEAQSVMSVNKTLLLSELIPKFENLTLNDVTFAHSIFCQALEVQRINGETFPDEFVIKSGSWINFGMKSFKKVNFMELSVGGYINYIKSSDLITKSTPQTVFGTKTFEKGIKIFGNLNILANTIDGVDINFLASNMQQNISKSVVIFEEEVSAPGVVVKGKVNNLTLEDIAEDLVYKDEFETVITGRKVFLQDLTIKKSAKSAFINKIDFSTFVNTEKSNRFVATKSFSEVVNFDSIRVKGLIDNTNLTELVEDSVLLLDRPYQTVTGDKYFQSMVVNQLDIIGELNRLPVQNLLTKSTDQVFSVDIILDQATFQNLSTKEVHIYKNGTLNERSILDIKNELQRAANLDTELTVEGDVIIKKELKVDQLNEHNVNDLYNLLLKHEKRQVITTDAHFADLTISGVISTAEHATGNATSLKRNAASALKIHEKNYVSENMWWETVEASELNVRGLINGEKLHQLHEDLVYLNDPNSFSIKGPKYFLNGFEVFGDLETNSVNGKDLRKDLFSRTTTQVIRSPATLGHIIAQNVYLKRFNRINVNWFQYAGKREKTVIAGPLTFHGYVHVSNLKLGGKIGDEDVLVLLNDAVDLSSKKVIISGKKTFVQPPTFSNLNVVILNSKKLEKRNKHEDSPLDFLLVNGTISAQKLTVHNLVTKNTSSLLSPSYLLRNYIVINSNVPGSLKFEHVVITENVIATKINDESLEEKFLTKNTDQILWHPVNISTMFTKDVNVFGLVNGYIIPNGTLTKDRTKVIQGSVLHNETVAVPGSLFVKGKFGKQNIAIPEDLIVLSKKNKYNGILRFTAPLITTYIESVDQTLNGIDLSTIDSNLQWYRNLFNQNLIAKPNITSYHDAMEAMYDRECQKTSRLQSLLTQTFVQPHSFELMSLKEYDGQKDLGSVIQPESPDVPVLVYKSASNHWMVNSLHFGECETKILKWDKSQLRFEEVRSLGNVGNVQQWKKLDYPDYDTVFLLAVTSNTGNCGLTRSSLWKVNHTSFKLEKVQDLEAASDSFVFPGSPAYLYLNVGYGHTLYAFRGGVLEKYPLAVETNEQILDLFKSFDKPGGGTITVQYYNDLLDIMDDNRRRVLYMPNVKDIAIMIYLKDVVFIISKMQTGLRGVQYTAEIHLYQNLNLMLISTENFKESTQILPLDIPEDDSDMEMVFALSASSPRVYRIGGEPFMRIWTEFPLILGENLWASQFIDSENNFYLIFGDKTKILSLRLKKEGRKYHGSILQCT